MALGSDSVLALVDAATTTAVAIVVLLPRPFRLTNVLLALFLALNSVDSILVAVAGTNVGWLGANAQLWRFALIAPTLACYLAFAASALDTPLLRAFQTVAGKGVLLLASASSFIVVALAPHEFIKAYDAGGFTPGPWSDVLDLVYVVYGFTFLCALHACLRSAPRSLRRRQSVLYAISFGVLELGNMASLTAANSDGFSASVRFAIAQIPLFVFLVLLVVALLRYQLFDFDLRVKWTLRRGTLATLLLGAFLIATTIAEQYVQSAGPLVGGLCVGLLLFALRPIEKGIDRLADRAMPRTKSTSEYLAFRKLEVYKAALESARESGGIDARERAMLALLRLKLGITEGDAQALESDAVPA